MIVPIKLYYDGFGGIVLDNNRNVTPLITKLSSLSYRLYFYCEDFIPAVDASFEKADGTQETLPMAYSNTETDEYGWTWFVYFCDLPDTITQIANSVGNNNLLVSFNYLDGNSVVTLNTSAFTLHCTYAISNALFQFEMTPMEYYQYQYNLALQQRAMENQAVLHVAYLPSPSADNNGYVYLLEGNDSGFLKGDIVISNGSTYSLICSKPTNVLLNATSGTLTNQEYLYAQKDNTIIVINDGVSHLETYFKISEDSDYIVYKSILKNDLSNVDYHTLSCYVLTITKANKNYVSTLSSDDFYNKTQTDYQIDTRSFTTVTLTNSSGTLSNDDFAKLTQQENTILIYKASDTTWVYMLRASSNNTNVTTYVGFPSAVMVANLYTTQETLHFYNCLISNSTQGYTIRHVNDTFYTKLGIDPVIITSTYGQFDPTDYAKLTQQDNVLVLYKIDNDNWIQFVKVGQHTSDVGKYFGVNPQYNLINDETLVYYWQVTYYLLNFTALSYTISTFTNFSVYSATDVNNRFNAIENAYLRTASAVGDTLTITGFDKNGSPQTTSTTFDVSHKLDKDFSGISYNEASVVGQNDYFVINVGGTPKKVSWQTIYDQLGVGGLTEHFLGTYASLSALETAYPTANAGDYAYITELDGTDTILTMAIWDSTDNEWQVQDMSLYVLDSVYQADKSNMTSAINGKSTVTLVEWS